MHICFAKESHLFFKKSGTDASFFTSTGAIAGVVVGGAVFLIGVAWLIAMKTSICAASGGGGGGVAGDGNIFLDSVA